MKYCVNCGKQIREQAKFCHFCGANNSCQSENFMFCEECGEQIDVLAQYCSKCGTAQNYEQKAHLTEIGIDENENKAEEQVIVPVATVVPSKTVEPEQNAPVDKNDDFAENKTAHANEEDSKSIRCLQCGSTDIEIVSDEIAKCRHCGALIDYGKPKTIYNNTNINLFSNERNLPVSFYEIDAEYDKKKFQEQVFIWLTENTSTPVDVLDSIFSDVTLEKKKVIIYIGQVNMSYNATVGIDRQEEYIEIDSKGNPRKQYRTVTDWHPTSGNYSGEFTQGAPNGEFNKEEMHGEKGKYLDYAPICVGSSKNEKPCDKNEFLITQSGEDFAKEEMKKTAEFKCRCQIGGDHIKDFSCSSFVNITKIAGYVLPEYTMYYEIHDQEYHISSYAAGKFNPYGTYPNQSNAIDDEADTKNLIFSIPAFIMLIISSILSFVLKPILPIVILFLIATALFTISRFAVEKFRNNIVNNRQKIKQDKLLQKLSEMGKGE